MEHLKEDDVIKLSTVLAEPPWAKDYRISLFNSMKVLPMPSFKYSSSIIVKPDFKLSTLDIKKSAKFKVNYTDHSHLDIIHASSLAQLSKGLIHKFADISDGSKFSLFNDAFATNYLYLKVPKRLESPVTISIDADGLPGAMTIFIHAEKDSLATIIFQKKSTSSGYLGTNFKILSEDRSRINIVNIQEYSKDVFSFEDRCAKIGRDARVNWVDLSLGSGYSNNSLISNLDESGASTSMSYLFFAKDKQVFDIFTSAIHNAPHTQSNVLTRGVVAGSSRVLSRGLIVIGKNASGSQGFEKQDALILDSGAEADAIPNLEINNHDVKCSHGSTIGQIDYEKLFYLMSRGMSEDDAKKLIIRGYFAPVLELFQGDDLAIVEEALDKFL